MYAVEIENTANKSVSALNERKYERAPHTPNISSIKNVGGKMKRFIVFLCFFVILNLSATIINIPADQPTIQAGIDASVNADTVLVQPGTYYENINYNGKNITVASLFLTIQDTAYISQTIIDGNQNGSVVIFENGEDSTAVLIGFSITNGNDYMGGGINCSNSAGPMLVNLLVFGNYAEFGGGGIKTTYCSPDLYLINSKIYNNVVSGFGGGYGGGIYSSTSRMRIENSEITCNSASYGGGIYFNYDNHSNLINLIISNNSADVGGGIYSYNSDIILENIIIHNNQASSIGGGIYNYWNANPSMGNVSIVNNSAQLGGGVYCKHNSGFTFSSENRCSIYQNNQFNSRGIGKDIYMDDCSTMNVIVDTFTVLNPTDNLVSPIDSFTFDILYGAQDDLVNSDLYISVDGNNTNTGTTLTDPLKTITYALSIIYTDSLNQHTIFLAPGTYAPSTNEETFPIEWNNYVSLEGIEDEDTILDAENTNGVISFHYVSNSEIKNITIKNGYHQYYPQNTRGSGVYCYESSPSFINVAFIDNQATPNGGGFISYYSNPYFENVLFSGNDAWTRGGAIYSYQSIITIVNSEISENISGFAGGGITCDESELNLLNVVFFENSTDLGGAISIMDESNSLLENVVITNNSGNYAGGGIHISDNSNISLIASTVSNNKSDFGGGGGIYSIDSESIYQDVIISDNSAEQGGGLYLNQNSSITLNNTSIINNTADLGGGVYCENNITLNFNDDNRSSIYNNSGINSRGFGCEIYAIDCNNINVLVDTFTVWNPSDYYASPISNFTFDILHSIQDSLINSDLFVSVDGDNSNAGTSSDQPLKTIGYALSRIYTDSLNHHTINVSSGNYSPSSNGEQFPLEWSDYVSLIGSNMDNVILDADSTSRILNFHNVQSANINNITITNGFAEGNSPHNFGGGVYCHNSDVNFENVRIEFNSAFCGGGIYCDQNSNPNFENVIFSNNYAADNGGAFFCDEANPNLSNVDFTENFANEAGGAFYCEKYSFPIFENVIIENNSASTGGGLYFYNSSEPYLLNVTISGNNSENGGGIYSSWSQPIIENVKILINSTPTNTGSGGGIYLTHSDPILINVLLTDNYSSYNGAAIYCFYSNPSLYNVTLSANAVYDEGNLIFCSSSELNSVNSIFWNEQLDEIVCDIEGNENVINISYSNLEGGESGIITQNNAVINWGNGNIDVNPIFNQFGEEPFSLQNNSPCIDIGLNSIPEFNLPIWDLINNQRIWDGDENGNAIIDMGAYEFGAPPYVDVDDNLIVQTHNILLFQNYPNPFNPTTTISFSIQKNSIVNLSIYNVKGQKVKNLANKYFIQGSHSIIWNGDDEFGNSVSSGVYYYKLNVNGKTEAVKKCLLLK